MENEKIIEKLLDKAYTCYKRILSKDCPTIARKLSRREPVTLDGIEYTCWRELVITTCGNIINDNCPDAEVEIELDGNSSTINVKLSEKDEEILQSKIKEMVA